MPGLQEESKNLLFHHANVSINDEALVLLLHLNLTKNKDLPYWKCSAFNLDSMGDNECQIEICFFKTDNFICEQMGFQTKNSLRIAWFVPDLKACAFNSNYFQSHQDYEI